MNNKILALVATLVTILFSVLFVELVLRIATPFPIHGESNIEPDAILGHRMKQGLDGIDKDGFRNPTALDRADVVILGDSHTYGFNVSSQESWPAQLADKTKLSVYNMGIGGYGILQYAALIDKAIEKMPKFILLGLYPANDLDDYCKLARLDHWKSILESEGMRTDVCALASNKGPISFATRMRRSIEEFVTSTAIGSTVSFIRSTQFAHGNGIYIKYANQKIWFSDYRIQLISWSLDLQSKSIQEGLRANKHFLNILSKKAAQANIKFGVLIIPSRERVLYQLASAQRRPLPTAFETAVNQENELARAFQKFFTERNIPVSDVLPSMHQALTRSREEDTPLYPLVDGHPLSMGYSAYAETAQMLIQKMTDRKFPRYSEHVVLGH